MSYRCSLCRDDVPHGRTMLRHILYRPNGDIARELPVCVECKSQLDRGVPLANLLTLVKTESQWKVKKVKMKLAPVGRSATEREITKLKAQIAALQK